MPACRRPQRVPNGDVIGPLTGQIRLPEPCRIGPATADDPASWARDLGLLALERRDVLLERLPVGARVGQQLRLA